MEAWGSEDELVAARTRIESSLTAYRPPAAYGVGVATVASSGAVLDTWYPQVNTAEHRLPAAVMASVCGYRHRTGSWRVETDQLAQAIEQLAPALACTTVEHPNLRAWRGLLQLMGQPAPAGGARLAVAAFVADLADPLADAHDAYLRLHLLSHRKVRPHGTNLDGIFTVLPTVVWTTAGPFAVDDFPSRRFALAAAGIALEVLAVDKFPRMVDYVVPDGVRIADANRVRLGAHLAEGTVVMHEGFCNYNAGTLGPAMVEGRISAGVTVDSDSDIGGGASIMGTLSGGGTKVVSVGRGCLIGANGGIGISLGDNCTVEAGLYVTAGTRIALADGTVMKARDLSGQSNLLYRRNSQTGAVEALTLPPKWEGLNPDLHT